MERDARGRVAKVDRESFDRLRHIHGDSSKRHEPPAPEPIVLPTNATLDGARREQIVEATRLTRLRLAAEARLWCASIASRKPQTAGRGNRRQVDILPFLDDLIAAYQREDMHGVRMAAKRANEQMRARIAEPAPSWRKPLRRATTPLPPKMNSSDEQKKWSVTAHCSGHGRSEGCENQPRGCAK